MTSNPSDFADEAARRSKWESMAAGWPEAQPPAIPSPGDVKIFASEIEAAVAASGRNAVAILGATWRLREIFLCQDLSHLTTFCIDWSQIMYDINTKILGHKPSPETFVHGSWISYALGQKVAAIIGDKILDNLPFAEWPAFFDTASKHLAPRGRLILHCAPVPEDIDPVPGPREYLAKWAQLKHDHQLSTQDAASGFWEDLLTSSAVREPDKNLLSIAKYADALNTLRPVDPGESEILGAFHTIFGHSLNSTWCAYRLKDIVEQAGKGFRLLGLHNASDYGAAHQQPIVSLERLTV